MRCAFCDETTTGDISCPQCRAARYCSRGCLKKHKKHKKSGECARWANEAASVDAVGMDRAMLANVRARVDSASRFVRLTGRTKGQSHCDWMGAYELQQGWMSNGRPVYTMESEFTSSCVYIWHWAGTWNVSDSNRVGTNLPGGITNSCEAATLEDADGMWQV